MILNKRPLTLAEAKSYLPKNAEKKPVDEYMEKFTKVSKEKAVQIVKEIEALNNPKIKEEDMIKVADFLPSDSADINKIFNEVSLSEDEANKILEIVKKHQ